MAVDLQKKLSAHFTLGELTKSETASRRGIANIPGPAELAALQLLCVHVLERVRVHFGKPVVITSGYRSPRLNAAIKGSASSQHCRGEAADFTVPGVSNLEVCRWMHRHLNYDQLIYEFGEDGWIHCSYSARQMRNMELSAVRRGGKTVYLPGIIA